MFSILNVVFANRTEIWGSLTLSHFCIILGMQTDISTYPNQFTDRDDSKDDSKETERERENVLVISLVIS